MKPTLLLKNCDTNKNYEQDAINFQRKVAKTRKKADEQRRSEKNKQVDYFKEFDITKVKWMHLSCALFVPEIGFLDEMIKQPIIGKIHSKLDYYQASITLTTKDSSFSAQYVARKMEHVYSVLKASAKQDFMLSVRDEQIITWRSKKPEKM